MKNSPTASPQCAPPPNRPNSRQRRLLEVGPSGQTAPPQPELLHPTCLERFIAVGCNGAGSTAARADLLVRDDVVDASALHVHADRCRVAAHFENNPMNLLEPEGHFWSLFTPWHGDELNALQKKKSDFRALPQAHRPGFPANLAREVAAPPAPGAQERDRFGLICALDAQCWHTDPGKMSAFAWMQEMP